MFPYPVYDAPRQSFGLRAERFAWRWHPARLSLLPIASASRSSRSTSVFDRLHRSFISRRSRSISKALEWFNAGGCDPLQPGLPIIGNVESAGWRRLTGWNF
jgi:hypothetical protein